MRFWIALFGALSLSAAQVESELIFPLETWHNHSSSIVELPNGDLFVAWFHGSGERRADDVMVLGARWVKSRRAWTKPMLLADTPGFPDCNSVLYLDSQNRLWLFWAQIVANEWHTALTKYKRASQYDDPDAPPKWDWSDSVVVVPREIAERTKAAFPDNAKLNERAADKYFSRMGWFMRTHPITLPSGRMLLPMYSDGYSYGLVAISDDHGTTWRGSTPIIGAGGIQPSIQRRKDGTLIAYLRDNGPAPKRMQMSVSKDEGETWSVTTDTDVPNPGSSVEAIVLKTGEWLLVHNDLEKGRNRLRVSLSDDEGATWKWSRYLEEQTAGQYHYPSVIQSRDGSIHVTYSFFTPTPDGERKAIKHARFDLDWVRGR